MEVITRRETYLKQVVAYILHLESCHAWVFEQCGSWNGRNLHAKPLQGSCRSQLYSCSPNLFVMGIEQLPNRYYIAASPVDVAKTERIDRSAELGRGVGDTTLGLGGAQKNAVLRIRAALTLVEEWLVSDRQKHRRVPGLADKGVGPVCKDAVSGRYPKMVCTVSGRKYVTARFEGSRRLSMPMWECELGDVVNGAAARRAATKEAAGSFVLESKCLLLRLELQMPFGCQCLRSRKRSWQLVGDGSM
jgi:hypothetical protein